MDDLDGWLYGCFSPWKYEEMWLTDNSLWVCVGVCVFRCLVMLSVVSGASVAIAANVAVGIWVQSHGPSCEAWLFFSCLLVWSDLLVSPEPSNQQLLLSISALLWIQLKPPSGAAATFYQPLRLFTKTPVCVCVLVPLPYCRLTQEALKKPEHHIIPLHWILLCVCFFSVCINHFMLNPTKIIHRAVSLLLFLCWLERRPPPHTHALMSFHHLASDMESDSQTFL